MRVGRKIIIRVLVTLVIVVSAALTLHRLAFHRLTGRWFPVSIVEVLHSPSRVVGWSEDGLRLSDGRTLQLPGFRKLPRESPALTEVTKRGVEIAADSRVYGLVRIHHTCGNDPVRKHIARVDVANMLRYLRQGDWPAPLSTTALKYASPPTGGTFSEWGWYDSEFNIFRTLETMNSWPN